MTNAANLARDRLRLVTGRHQSRQLDQPRSDVLRFRVDYRLGGLYEWRVERLGRR